MLPPEGHRWANRGFCRGGRAAGGYAVRKPHGSVLRATQIYVSYSKQEAGLPVYLGNVASKH